MALLTSPTTRLTGHLSPDRVRLARDEQGLTRAELAEMVGTSTATIKRIERSPREVLLSLAQRIAVALDAPLASLQLHEADGSDPPQGPTQTSTATIRGDDHAPAEPC